MAILFNANAQRLLEAIGFRKLNARVTYLSRESGAIVSERAPVFALDLSHGSLFDDINALGHLHLGTGSW